MEERIIYWVVALLIWFPLLTDQYFLEYRSIEGKVIHISAPIRSHKGFKATTIKLKELNKFEAEYSVNPQVAEKLSTNVRATLYETRLLFRVIGIQQNGVLISNRAGGINMVILVAIFLLPLYLVSALLLWFFRKVKRL